MACTALLSILFVWMPETGRNIVGNGSIPPRGINMSLLDMLSRRRKHEVDPEFAAAKKQRKAANPLRCLTIISQKDVCIVLVANGLIYTGFYCVTVGFSSQLATVYNLTTLKIGLCFLPYGAGCTIGSIVIGRLLDYEFRKFARNSGYGDGRNVRQNPDFPLERARLSMVWYLVAVTAADTLVFWLDFPRQYLHCRPACTALHQRFQHNRIFHIRAGAAGGFVSAGIGIGHCRE
ncbi:hypothetical protein V1504DRAFT_433184 [Lipomyces starkeyi]